MPSFNRKAAAVFACILTFFFTVYITAAVTHGLDSNSSGTVYVTDESGETLINRYERLNEVLERVENEYYTDVDESQLIQGAIDGMLGTLDDPYTFYYTPEEMTASTEEHSGLYYGIGVQVTSDAEGNLVVSRVFKGGSADKAGIRRGDILASADGFPLIARDSNELSEAIAHIKGEEGKVVLLTVKRGEEKFEVSVACGDVTINRVEYEMLDEDVGYLILYDFFGDAVSGVKQAFNYFESNGARSLIFDLRGNSGGQLDVCLDISDMFLPEGVIVYTVDREGEETKYYSDSDCIEIPLYVLVNSSTASASEIFAGAVQDYAKGVIVGTQTFGKGIVQTCYSFPSDGAGMQLTTSVYYTPNGRSLHMTGITPDILVEEEIAGINLGPDMEKDPQLRTAYENAKRQNQMREKDE